MFLCHSGSDVDSEIKYIDMLHAQRVAGIIWIPGTADFTPYQRISGYGIRTVIIDRLVSNDDVPAVTADNYHGGILATKHLIDLGHRRIGYISRPVDLSHSKGRFQGYQAALQQAGIAFDPNLVVKGGFVLEDGRQAVRQLLALDEPPTAISAYNDIMAIGALRALHENGLRVPDDFSLVGFDDIAQASFTCPALTTIYLPKYEMGQRGAELLIALIEKKKPDARVLRPLDVELVVRESTGPVKNQIEHRSTH